MAEELNHPSRYVKLKKDQAPLEDITPGELNQPIDVPQLHVRKCNECGQPLPESYQAPADEPWSTGIFECAQDMESCRTGLLCPCVLFGRNVEQVREDTPWTGPCIFHAVFVEGGIAFAAATAALHGFIDPRTTFLICEGLLFSWWMCGIYTGLMRQSLQKKYHLQNSPCDPCMVHCCMHWCALCQEHREMKGRLSDDTVMPMTVVNPPPVQEMNASSGTRDSASPSSNGVEQVHKKKHRQLRTVICGRCRFLSHGYMITAVGGNGGYAGGKQFVTAEELREKLSHLRHEKALIVKLVDAVDFNGSFLSRIRDIAGANPIILVVTKVDLLPKGTDLNCVGDWVVEATIKKKLNVLSVHLTSSKSLVGITGVISEIQKEKKGRDIYILGSANVGKSAFINALLKIMSYRDPVAAAARRYKPIQSAVPGTTLGLIQIDAFLGGGKLYDTPGVHLHHRQAAVVHSEDLPALAPQSRLRGLPLPNPQLGLDKSMTDRIRSNGLIGFSIFWGGLVRVDVIEVLPETRLTFYGPKALQLHMVPTDEAEEFYRKEIGTLLTPPKGIQKPENWAGLEAKHELLLKYQDIERPACDVAISGLGWISVEPFSQFLKSSDPSEVEESGVIALKVHLPKPVEIFVRPPLPVGNAGGEWYQYNDLTEKEEEVRPKWYF